MIPPNKGIAIHPKVKIELGNNKKYQLYNLKEDIGQQNNLAESNPEKLSEMITAFKNIRGKAPKNIKKLVSSIQLEVNRVNFLGPIFLKISPDEPFELIKNIAEIVEKSSFTGLIVSNTTISKDSLKNKKNQIIEGGLSGAPLMDKSTALLKRLNDKYPNLTLIGAGGVMTKSDFNKKILSGASLVQIYTGFIIKGPKIVEEILN